MMKQAQEKEKKKKCSLKLFPIKTICQQKKLGRQRGTKPLLITSSSKQLRLTNNKSIWINVERDIVYNTIQLITCWSSLIK